MFSKSVKRKIEKYEKQFRPLVWGTSLSCLLFITLVSLYFFPTVLYSKYGFLKVNEKTLQDILQISFTVVGVFFGVFLQQLFGFLIVPDKEVLHPLNKKSLFPEFFSALEEFSDKIKKDEKGLLDDKRTNITILLSSPVLVDFDEIPKIIKDENYKTKYEILVNEIFNSEKKFERKIICLDIFQSQQQGLSPIQRFIKSFSGFIISEQYGGETIKDREVSYYRDVDTFRRNIAHKVSVFCDSPIIKEYMKFAKEDDLQWQAIVVKAPQIRFYKAVVGFYGEDFFKKYSFLGLMNEIKSRLIDPDNQGFVSDEPDIVEWVMTGLVNPYIPDKEQKARVITHHSSGVHDKITKEKPCGEGTTEESVMIDNLKTLETVNVTYTHGPNSILREIEYPMFDGTISNLIKIKYCQYLFHPLIAESATWSSLNIRMLGDKRVLDMCCGIGVQGLASIDKGATFVHGVDNDPIALLCTIENYKRKVNNKSSIQVSVTLSEGFENVKAKTFNEFEKIFKDTLNNSTWNGNLNDQRKEEILKLFEDNRNYAQEIYKGCISKDFDIIILEPPFVEFSEDNASPSHDSLYDKHFVVTRSLLTHAKDYLKQSQDSKDWKKPYVFQSFSSLENIVEFENYIDGVVRYKIFRKSCIEKNGAYWYCYYLIPIYEAQSQLNQIIIKEGKNEQ
ncbi:50S ribosomal protein L11 methyltransferase [Patescibacteria group bacterium]|nr:50S ribosomal protein L11 methyltransferase [Nanoarchaeota archaeon]MBU1758136.1 50S ribosomal protein L11 methyltransferase [Patescibacteria group bacterium]